MWPLALPAAAALAHAIAVILLIFKINKIGQAVGITAIIIVGVYIVFSWHDLARPPFRNLSETLTLLALCLGIVGYLSAAIYDNCPIPAFASAISAMILLYTILILDGFGASEMPAALQSIWFVPHVCAYFTGYAYVTLSGALAFAYLIMGKERLISLADSLSSGSFLFLALGLCLGSVWAHQAWGSWWSWDLKESFALSQWLLIASYRHMPNLWRKSRYGATLLSSALFLTAFMYLGLDLLPAAETSLHVYAND